MSKETYYSVKRDLLQYLFIEFRRYSIAKYLNIDTCIHIIHTHSIAKLEYRYMYTYNTHTPYHLGDAVCVYYIYMYLYSNTWRCCVCVLYVYIYLYSSLVMLCVCITCIHASIECVPSASLITPPSLPNGAFFLKLI